MAKGRYTAEESKLLGLSGVSGTAYFPPDAARGLMEEVRTVVWPELERLARASRNSWVRARTTMVD